MSSDAVLTGKLRLAMFARYDEALEMDGRDVSRQAPDSAGQATASPTTHGILLVHPLRQTYAVVVAEMTPYGGQRSIDL